MTQALGDEYTPAEARLNRVFDRLTSRIREIIMTSAESIAEGVVAQLAKAKGEIDGVIASLQNESVSPETLAKLSAISQSLDDEVPDAPVDEPDPEPTPDPTPVDDNPAPPVDETPVADEPAPAE